MWRAIVSKRRNERLLGAVGGQQVPRISCRVPVHNRFHPARPSVRCDHRFSARSCFLLFGQISPSSRPRTTEIDGTHEESAAGKTGRVNIQGSQAMPPPKSASIQFASQGETPSSRSTSRSSTPLPVPTVSHRPRDRPQPLEQRQKSRKNGVPAAAKLRSVAGQTTSPRCTNRRKDAVDSCRRREQHQHPKALCEIERSNPVPMPREDLVGVEEKSLQWRKAPAARER